MVPVVDFHTDGCAFPLYCRVHSPNDTMVLSSCEPAISVSPPCETSGQANKINLDVPLLQFIELVGVSAETHWVIQEEQTGVAFHCRRTSWGRGSRIKENLPMDISDQREDR